MISMLVIVRTATLVPKINICLINISELNRLGVPYVIYLYTYASTEADSVEDAEQTIALIKNTILNQLTLFTST